MGLLEAAVDACGWRLPESRAVGAAGRASACGGPGHANPCSKLVSCPGAGHLVNVSAWACEPPPVGLGLISASPPPGYQNNGVQPELANAAYDQGV
jgi:hypothetical protein